MKSKQQQQQPSESPDSDDDGFSYEDEFMSRLGATTAAVSKTRALLPTKDKGLLVYRETTVHRELKKGFEALSSSEEGEEEEDLKEAPALKVSSAAEALAVRQTELQKTKQLIASIASDVLGDPEANISRMKELFLLCSEGDTSARKLSVLSGAEIFKDILPGYYIRDLTEKEKEVKVSKEVKKLRDYESALIKNYKDFLTLLEAMSRDCARTVRGKGTQGSHCKAALSLMNCIVSSMCDLVLYAPHFNYRAELVKRLVSLANMKGPFSQVSDCCCSIFVKVFEADKTGAASLDVVRAITHLVKIRPDGVQPKILESLLHLNLSESVLDSEPTGGQKGRSSKRPGKSLLSRRDKKKMKLETQLNKDLREMEIQESQEQLHKLQTEILKTLMTTYFRIMKAEKRSPLLEMVLRGVARYAHLLNLEYCSDLIAHLRVMLDSEKLKASEACHCVLTGLKILSGKVGDTLNIDPAQFYNYIYSLISESSRGDSESWQAEVFESLNLLLLNRRKQVSLPRLMGFIKRLTTLCLYYDTTKLKRVFPFLAQIISLHPKATALLDSECTVGKMYRPDLDDPEFCNADGTLLWELTLLHKHNNKFAQRMANQLSQCSENKPPQARSTQGPDRSDLEELDFYLQHLPALRKAAKSDRHALVRTCVNANLQVLVETVEYGASCLDESSFLAVNSSRRVATSK